MCCHFGEDRIATWPSYLFCHPCAMCENERRTENVISNRKHKKYQCTVGHHNFEQLTTKRKKWIRDTIKNDVERDDSIVQELNNNNQNHEAKKAHNLVSYMQKHKHRIRELENQKHTVAMTNYRLKED